MLSAGLKFVISACVPHFRHESLREGKFSLVDEFIGRKTQKVSGRCSRRKRNISMQMKRVRDQWTRRANLTSKQQNPPLSLE